MPMPPACFTTSPFSTLPFTPLVQTTILLRTLAGSSVPAKHSVELSGIWFAALALSPLII